MRTLAIHPVGAELLVHFVGAKVELFAFSMGWTGLGHEDLSIALKDFCIQNHVTVRTDALGIPYGLPLLLLFLYIR